MDEVVPKLKGTVALTGHNPSKPIKSQSTMNSSANKSKSQGLITLHDLNHIEEYEIKMALIHRHNEAYARLKSDGKCYGNGTFSRSCDESSVEVCTRLIKMLDEDW